MWILWFAFLQSSLAMHFIIGDGFPSGQNQTPSMPAFFWVAAFLPSAIAVIVRWLVIPRVKAPQQQLVAMIIGLSLAEFPIFISLFLIGSEYPKNQIAVLVVAVFSLIQFAPSYATPGYDLKS